MIELSGKYAVTLYELLESASNKETPELDASVDELRRWPKVPLGKMTRWQDFRRKILDKTLSQINDNPEGAGFTVTYTPIKEGRAIKRVLFEIEKSDSLLKIEEQLKDRQLSLPLENGLPASVATKNVTPVIDEHISVDEKQKDSSFVTALREAGLSPRDSNNIEKKQWEIIETEDRPEGITFERYIEEKIDLVKRKKASGDIKKSATGFLLKAIKENWSNPEFVEVEKEPEVSEQTRTYMEGLKKIQMLEKKYPALREAHSQQESGLCEEIANDDTARLVPCHFSL